MKLGFCSTDLVSPSSLTLIAALEEAGHSVEVITRPPTREGESFDLAYYRGKPYDTSEGYSAELAVIWMEAAGVSMVNSLESVLSARHKLLSWQKFKKAGLPIPATFHYSYQPDTQPETGKWIVKPDAGFLGGQISVFDSWDMAQRYSNNLDENTIIQHYLAGEVIRIVASSSHGLYGNWVSEEGDKVSLASGGSQGKLSEEDLREYSPLATAANRALGLNLSGVDLLITETGPVVLEANSGFRIHRADDFENSLLVKEFEQMAKYADF